MERERERKRERKDLPESRNRWRSPRQQAQPGPSCVCFYLFVSVTFLADLHAHSCGGHFAPPPPPGGTCRCCPQTAPADTNDYRARTCTLGADRLDRPPCGGRPAFCFPLLSSETERRGNLTRRRRAGLKAFPPGLRRATGRGDAGEDASCPDLCCGAGGTLPSPGKSKKAQRVAAHNTAGRSHHRILVLPSQTDHHCKMFHFISLALATLPASTVQF